MLAKRSCDAPLTEAGIRNWSSAMAHSKKHAPSIANEDAGPKCATTSPAAAGPGDPHEEGSRGGRGAREVQLRHRQDPEQRGADRPRPHLATPNNAADTSRRQKPGDGLNGHP